MEIILEKKSNKTGLIIKWFFDTGENVLILRGKNFKDLATWLNKELRLKRNRLNREKAIKFVGDKVLKMPDCPYNILYDILRQVEPMEREMRILKYKLENKEKYPEIQNFLV